MAKTVTIVALFKGAKKVDTALKNVKAICEKNKDLIESHAMNAGIEEKIDTKVYNTACGLIIAIEFKNNPSKHMLIDRLMIQIINAIPGDDILSVCF